MHRPIRPTLLALALTLMLAFGAASPAAAQGITYGSGIPAGATVEQDVFLVGQNVSIDGTVDGNVFVLADQATINGTVNGSLVLVGQNAAVGRTVSGAVYAAALTLDLGPQADLGRDLYVAAVSLTSGQGSIIGRDLYAVGLDSGLSGRVGRSLHTAIGPLQLYNGIMRLLGFDELTIKLHITIPTPQPAPSGLLPSTGRAPLRPANTTPRPFDWDAWGLGLLRNWAVLFVLGVLFAWLLRRPLHRLRTEVHERPLTATGIGLLVLVFTFAIIGAAVLLVILIFVLGLALNSLGLWPFTLGLWALIYSALALALTALWFGVVYGTKIVVAYAAAAWLLGLLLQRRAFWTDVLALLAGTAIYSLLRTVPYVGWIVDVLVTAAGAGTAWLAYRAWRQPPAALPPEPIKKASRRPASRTSR